MLRIVILLLGLTTVCQAQGGDVSDTWINRALHLSRAARERRYAEGKAQGAAYMLECRDMWDADDQDAGVFFTLHKSREEAVARIREMAKTPDHERVLAVYDLRQPLLPQGPGQNPRNFLAPDEP